MAGIDGRGMTDRVNIVVVSDHGMAAVIPNRVIVLSDYLDLESVDIIESDPNLSLNPRTGTADDLYRRLARAHPHLRVYRREETPPAWRYRAHPRIAAVVGVADEGWTVVRTRPHGVMIDRGNHGFDPRLRSMHGVFIAAGPAFQRRVVVPPFENVHVYNALAAALGVTPAKNDGDPAIAQKLLTR
jgi:predicted AlkP superfamily pyrophosphatase or phosphodiesterase